MRLTESTRRSLDAQLEAQQYNRVASILERVLKATPKESASTVREQFWKAVSSKEPGGDDHGRYRAWKAKHQLDFCG